MSPWLWWTAPHQRREQAYCSALRKLPAAERAQWAIDRRAGQVKHGDLYGERSAENSNLSP